MKQMSTRKHDSSIRIAGRLLLAVFFVLAGINHFISPKIYLGMMPPWLPAPEVANVVSGTAEIIGGLGLLFSQYRRIAGWGLIALLIAVFPANLHVAQQGHMPGLNVSPLILWLRLPLQPGLIAWVWWAALRRSTPGGML